MLLAIDDFTKCGGLSATFTICQRDLPFLNAIPRHVVGELVTVRNLDCPFEKKEDLFRAYLRSLKPRRQTPETIAFAKLLLLECSPYDDQDQRRASLFADVTTALSNANYSRHMSVSQPQPFDDEFQRLFTWLVSVELTPKEIDYVTDHALPVFQRLLLMTEEHHSLLFLFRLALAQQNVFQGIRTTSVFFERARDHLDALRPLVSHLDDRFQQSFYNCCAYLELAFAQHGLANERRQLLVDRSATIAPFWKAQLKLQAAIEDIDEEQFQEATRFLSQATDLRAFDRVLFNALANFRYHVVRELWHRFLFITIFFLFPFYVGSGLQDRQIRAHDGREHGASNQSCEIVSNTMAFIATGCH
jgi:hypothetical protein